MGNTQTNQVSLYEMKETKKLERTLTKIKQITPPTPRVGQKMIQVRNTIFLFGGYTGNEYARDMIHVMDLKTFKWTKISSNNPPSRTGFTIVKYREQIIYFGGFDKTVYHYSVHSNYFFAKHAPFGTRFHDSFVYEDKMFVFGGMGEGENENKEFYTYYYNLTTYEWKKITTYGDIPPKSTHHHKIIVTKNKRIFLAGETGFYEFNIINYNWKLISSDNSFLKRCNSMFAIGKFIYFIGALNKDSKIYRYDIEKRIIEKFDSGDYKYTKLVLSSSCLVHLESKFIIYCFGGFDNGNYGFLPKYYNELYSLDVTEEEKYEFNDTNENLEFLKKSKICDVHFLFLEKAALYY
eukprot:gene6159-10166_t